MSKTTSLSITSADGTPINASSAGDPSKPAVVYIHCFACTSLHFAPQFSDALLLSKLYLIRYDVRGHGRSGQPLEKNAYESLRHAEDFRAVCEMFGVVRPFVAGWSLGGIIAADVAAAYGIDYISGSILLGGMPYRSMHPQVVYPVIRSLLPHLLSGNAADFAKACVEFALSCVAEGFEIPEDVRLMGAEGIAIQHPLVRVHTLQRTQDETALLAAKDTFPFLVLHGDEDRPMYLDKMEKFMKENFGNVEFHRLEGVGHAAFLEKPEFVNPTILKFVNRVTAVEV